LCSASTSSPRSCVRRPSQKASMRCLLNSTWEFILKGPIHSRLNCAVYLCKKIARKTELNVLWHSTGFPSGLSVFFCQFCVSSVRVTMLDKNKAVICCLLATSAIMLSKKKKRKRKMWSKKWYLKRNISCDAHLMNEFSALR